MRLFIWSMPACPRYMGAVALVHPELGCQAANSCAGNSFNHGRGCVHFELQNKIDPLFLAVKSSENSLTWTSQSDNLLNLGSDGKLFPAVWECFEEFAAGQLIPGTRTDRQLLCIPKSKSSLVLEILLRSYWPAKCLPWSTRPPMPKSASR